MRIYLTCSLIISTRDYMSTIELFRARNVTNGFVRNRDYATMKNHTNDEILLGKISRVVDGYGKKFTSGYRERKITYC